MLPRMKLLAAVAAPSIALVLALAGCAAIQNADREVNKKTDHGTSHGAAPDADGGATTTPAGQDAGITSM
jgi:hypothetical protein